MQIGCAYSVMQARLYNNEFIGNSVIGETILGITVKFSNKINDKSKRSLLKKDDHKNN